MFEKVFEMRRSPSCGRGRLNGFISGKTPTCDSYLPCVETSIGQPALTERASGSAVQDPDLNGSHEPASALLPLSAAKEYLDMEISSNQPSVALRPLMSFCHSPARMPTATVFLAGRCGIAGHDSDVIRPPWGLDLLFLLV